MIHDLATLIAPEAPEFFHTHFLQKRRFHIKSSDRRRAEPLLPWTEIDRLIGAEAASSERIKVMRASNIVDGSMYRTDDGRGRVRAGVLQHLLRQGSSILIETIDQVVPAIGRLGAAIERELSSNVQVNAYLSFAAGSALKPHYDLHDVVVLQVQGRKRWRSYGVSVPYPINPPAPDAPIPNKVVWEDHMEPGDILFLPRGEIHEAEVDEGYSVHLTIGVLPRRGLDFAAAMIQQARENALFRQDIPVLGGAQALAEHEAALKGALHTLIDGTDLSGYLTRDSRARRLVPLMNLGIAPPFHDNSVIETAVRRRIQFDVETEGVVQVSFGGETFRLSAPARRVLNFLIWHDVSTFGTLVSALKAQLSARLVQEAVTELAQQGLVGLHI